MYICIYKYKWTDDKNKFKTTFDKAPLKLVISYFCLMTVFLALVICKFDKSL